MPGTIIVGAGQAGLATAYHLEQLGHPAQIIADDRRVGDSWRHRWDSLRLFTPAFYNSLPGLPFPAEDPDHLPVKDEVADYLDAYADRLEAPIRLETRVESIRPAGDDAGHRFELQTDGGTLRARNVVLATGAHGTPWRPPFADELPADTHHLHSAGYRNPDALPDGDVLVVGAGNSGTQIAAELARARPYRAIWLSGPDTGRLPRRLLGRDIYRWIGPTLLRARADSFLGRRLHRKAASGGDPVFKPEHQAMVDAGVRRVGRTTAVEDGRPVVEGRGALDVSAIVWCTGFHSDFSWVRVPGATHDDASPVHTRGVSPVPGLYYVGLPYLYRLDSSLLGGVSDDARYIARRVSAGD